MNQHKENLPQNRWELTQTTPIAPKELLIVPCDGCDQYPHLIEEIKEVIAQNQIDRITLLSLPSLTSGRDLVSRYRYTHADRRITISGCNQSCTNKLLASFKQDKVDLQLNPEQTQEINRQILADAIENVALSLHPAQQNQKNRRFAAQAKRKHFISMQPIQEQIQTTQKQSELTIEKENRSERVFSKTPTSNEQQTQKTYFTNQTKTSSFRWIYLLISILVLAGGYKLFASRTALKKQQKQTILVRSMQKKKAPHPKATKQTHQDEKRIQKQPKSVRRQPIPVRRQIKPIRRQPRSVRRQPIPVRKQPKPVRKKIIKRYSKEQVKKTKWFNKKWTGGICRNGKSCRYEGAMCLLSAAYGYCTRLCTKYCPDKKGVESSYCVQTAELKRYLPSLPSLNGGLCIIKCNFRVFPHTGCRIGAKCALIPLIRNPQIKKQLCVPVTKPSQRKEIH